MAPWGSLFRKAAQPPLSVISGPSKPRLLDWTFNDVLNERLKEDGDKVAIYSQHQGEEISYAELDRRAEKLALALYRLGVRQHDRVGVLLGNRSEYAVIMFACSKLGAYFTLFNYAYTPSELTNALEATTPKVLFATLTTCRFNYTSVLQKLGDLNIGLERIVLLDDLTVVESAVSSLTSLCSATAGRFLRYNEDLLQGPPGEPVDIKALEKTVKDSDILNLQFTSGSTGLPKTAALTHHGMLNSSRYIGLQMQIKPTDKINIPVPLFHAFGLVIG